MTLRPAHASAASVDPAEVDRFAAMAEAWWDPQGDFRPLHRLNPVRIGYIRDRAAAHFGRDPFRPRPLAGLRIADIGCGGGLLSEPIARLGADVVGVDAALPNIQIAATHAVQSGLSIDYRNTTVEALAAEGERFDIVLCLEVIEHVADLTSFVRGCSALLQPGGQLIGATLNRTFKSFGLAIVGAEYVLRWLPRGTHDWRRFVRPHEFARALRGAGLTVRDVSGVSYNPVRDDWTLGSDLDVNYLIAADKPAA